MIDDFAFAVVFALNQRAVDWNCMFQFGFKLKRSQINLICSLLYYLMQSYRCRYCLGIRYNGIAEGWVDRNLMDTMNKVVNQSRKIGQVHTDLNQLIYEELQYLCRKQFTFAHRRSGCTGARCECSIGTTFTSSIPAQFWWSTVGIFRAKLTWNDASWTVHAVTANSWIRNSVELIQIL